MLRDAVIITAALTLAGSAPVAAAQQSGDPPPPPSSIATKGERQYQDLRTPDARDAGAGRGLYHEEPPSPVSVVQVRGVDDAGFHWGDAAIGAAGMVAIFSIAAGATLLVSARRRRRPIQAVTR